MKYILALALLISLSANAEIPLKFECKTTEKMGDSFNDCDYKIGRDIHFGLMISKKDGAYTFTIYKQSDFFAKKLLSII